MRTKSSLFFVGVAAAIFQGVSAQLAVAQQTVDQDADPSTGHRMDGIMAGADHSISLNLAGPVAAAFNAYYDIYPLEASTNLMDWSPLAMLQRTNDSSGTLSYLAPDTANFGRRFYRTPTNFLITPFPKPSGPYLVGTVSWLLTDPSRSNRYNIPTNSSFMVTCWYPAEARAGVLPNAYVENNATLHSYLNPRSPATLAYFMSHAFSGLPVATNEPSYPVVLHSGNSTRLANTAQALELASHGYVVVALDHATWVTASVFPNGQVVSSPSICNATVECWQPTLDNAIKDILFVIEELNRLNTNHALFAGRLDLERLGVFGRSVTCVPMAEFCRIDARCKAVVLLDAARTLDLSANLTELGLQKPFLSMNCASSVGPWPPGVLGRPPVPPGSTEWLATTLALFAKATNDAFWFQIQDAGHSSFADRGSVISDPSLTADPTPASRAQSQTITDCMLSFFDKYLKNQDDHLLENPAVVYPTIINFRRK